MHNGEPRNLARHLGDERVHALLSLDDNVRREAIQPLPTELTSEELSSLAIWVSMSPGGPGPLSMEGGYVQKRTVHFIGSYALKERNDIVTAESAATELLHTDSLGGLMRWVSLKLAIRSKKKDIISSIIEGDKALD